MPIRKIRNPLARLPILHKGGVHIKTKANQRNQAKRVIKTALKEWKNESSAT